MTSKIKIDYKKIMKDEENIVQKRLLINPNTLQQKPLSSCKESKIMEESLININHHYNDHCHNSNNSKWKNDHNEEISR